MPLYRDVFGKAFSDHQSKFDCIHLLTLSINQHRTEIVVVVVVAEYLYGAIKMRVTMRPANT